MLKQEWAEYIRRRVPVTIRRSLDLQDPMWAVTVDEDPEFWMDAYEDRGDAVRFCQDNGLPYRIEGKTERRGS